MKPTPGPWEFACDSYGKVQHSRKYDCVYAIVKGEGGDQIVRIAARIENTKDAVLIASTPDLLAVCEMVATRMHDNVYEGIRQAAIAALAKSKGGDA